MEQNMNATTKRNIFQKVGHAIANGAKKVWNAKAGKVAIGKIGTVTVAVVGTLYAAYSFIPGVKTTVDNAAHKLNPFKKKEQEPAPENNGAQEQ